MREAEAPARQPPPAAELGAELQRAAALVNQSRQAVSSLFAEARMGNALDTEKCLPLVDEIATSVWRNPGAFVSLARLKTHDDYTYMHSMAVCALMVRWPPARHGRVHRARGRHGRHAARHGQGRCRWRCSTSPAS